MRDEGINAIIRYAECTLYPRFFDGGCIDGINDSHVSPRMPCVKAVSNDTADLAWCPIIDLNEGKILNWKKGISAFVHYKTVDCNFIIFKDEFENVIKKYEGYVPQFLNTVDNNADYVVMDIDSNGYIKNYRRILDDIDNQYPLR